LNFLLIDIQAFAKLRFDQKK